MYKRFVTVQPVKPPQIQSGADIALFLAERDNDVIGRDIGQHLRKAVGFRIRGIKLYAEPFGKLRRAFGQQCLCPVAVPVDDVNLRPYSVTQLPAPCDGAQNFQTDISRADKQYRESVSRHGFIQRKVPHKLPGDKLLFVNKLHMKFFVQIIKDDRSRFILGIKPHIQSITCRIVVFFKEPQTVFQIDTAVKIQQIIMAFAADVMPDRGNIPGQHIPAELFDSG